MQFSTNNRIDEAGEHQVDWYALYTSHQHERMIARSLTSRGYEIFLPLYEEVRQWSDRRKRLMVPLFPCYVFVKACLERRVNILVTPGVHGFVSFDNHPAPIPPAEIEDLRRIVGLAMIEPHPFLRCGDAVRVRYGPFQGIEGILVRKKGRTRLVLSVELLQKSAAIEIDAAMTEKLPRSRASQVQRFSDADENRISVTV